VFVRFRKIISRKKGTRFNITVQNNMRDHVTGQVKSETLCGLGSVAIPPKPFERYELWRKVDVRLPRLRLAGRLTPSDELKIRRLLAEKVPRI
jgi:hypothetical protein